jgi:phosphotransferase system HPr-like phosphotransfer protein
MFFDISIIKDESTIDGKSFLGLMILQPDAAANYCAHSGCDEKNAMEKIEDCLCQDLEKKYDKY